MDCQIDDRKTDLLFPTGHWQETKKFGRCEVKDTCAREFILNIIRQL